MKWREIFEIFFQLFIAIMMDISKMAIEMTKQEPWTDHNSTAVALQTTVLKLGCQ